MEINQSAKKKSQRKFDSSTEILTGIRPSDKNLHKNSPQRQKSDPPTILSTYKRT